MFGDLLVRPDDRRPAALHEPATAAQLNGPHDVTYDAAGNLLICGYRVRRRVIGTGRLGRHADRVAATRLGFLPSDVESVGRALLISQTQPVAAIRRIGPGSGLVTTLLR